MTGNLSSRAMLARLHIKSWSGRTVDKRVSKEIEDRYGAAKDIGRYSKSLVAKEALKEIKRIMGEARQHHYRNTLPWLDDGQRILPSANFFSYMDGVQKIRLEFEREVRSFVSNYSDYVEEGKTSLGGLFDPSEYPDMEKIEACFEFTSTINPIPSGIDFRVSLGSGEEEAIRTEIEHRVNLAAAEAKKDLFGRIYKVTSDMVEKLRSYTVDENEKVTKTFHKSVVGNVRDLIRLLPRLDISDDSDITNLACEMEAKLAVYEADELRDDDYLRNSVADEAEAISRKLAEFI